MATTGDYRMASGDYQNRTASGVMGERETLLNSLASTESRMMELRTDVRVLADELCGAIPEAAGSARGNLNPVSNGVFDGVNEFRMTVSSAIDMISADVQRIRDRL